MGTFSVTIEIGDPQGQRFEQIEAMVDDKLMPTVIQTYVLTGMGIVPTRRQVFEYAGGEQVELGMAEAIVRLQGKETHTWVIFGDESCIATLGKFTLGGLFLRVDSERERLVPARGVLATPILVD